MYCLHENYKQLSNKATPLNNSLTYDGSFKRYDLQITKEKDREVMVKTF